MIKTALISFLTASINTRLLAAYLKANGYQTICIFCPGEVNRANTDALLELLKTQSIGLIGISFVTDDYRSAVFLTRGIKERLDIPIIWGGAHANVKPEECLQHADMICLGEGEEALLDLVKSYSCGEPDLSTKNLWFRTNNGVIRNELRPLEENLDKHPFPDFDLTTQFVMSERGLEPFEERHLRSEYSIMTSRGCPYNCYYCYNSYRRKQFEGKGRYLRKRSVESIINELTMARTIFKSLRQINFWDDSMIARSTEEIQRFGNLYAEKIRLPFFALVEPMAFDRRKIELLKEAGLRKLQVGIQSGSERVNKEIYNRPVSNKKAMEIAQDLNRMGIDAVYDVIFNNPYETTEDVAKTARLLLQFPKPFFVQGYNLIFYPRTAITDRALQDGFISLKDDGPDFSTIQNPINSPTANLGYAKVSGRFYKINYHPHEKKYFNSIIALISSRYAPQRLLSYFAKSETPSKRILLEAFTRLYAFSAAVKRALWGPRLQN